MQKYTSENIARALGLGGFANDAQLAEAEQAIRLLLTPSFHVELCLTLMRKLGEPATTLTVVAAREQIWLQAGPVPRKTQVYAASCPVSGDALGLLSRSLSDAAATRSERVVISDGMRVHTVLRANRQCQIEVNENAGARPSYDVFVAAALELAWHAVGAPQLRNAIRAAGGYVGLALPETPLPPEKPTIRTVVLGSDDVAAQILEGLKQRHGH